MLKRLFNCCILLCVAGSAWAQYAVDQNQSLTALESVHVDYAGHLENNEAIHRQVELELRKVGLRIQPDSVADAIINVGYFTERYTNVDHVWSQDAAPYTTIGRIPTQQTQNFSIRYKVEDIPLADLPLKSVAVFRTTFRMDVEQDVFIERTGQTLQLVTWFYEREIYPGDQRQLRIDEIYERPTREAVDTFIDAFLTANGR